MKIKRIIEELIYILEDTKERLLELADSARELQKRIKDKAPTVIEHVYKIQQYGQLPRYQTTVHHWASEVVSNLITDCHKVLKNNKKQVSTKLIVDSLRDKFVIADEITGIVWNTCKDYEGFQVADIDQDRCYQNIFKVLPKLIDYIRSTRNPDIKHVIELIEEI